MRAPSFGWARCICAALLLVTPAHRLAAQAVAEVQVTPETMTLAVGQKQTVFAAGFDKQGNLIPNARFTFWSSDSSVVRVQRDGTVIGLKPGLAKVEVRAQNARASLAVLVAEAGAVASSPSGSARPLAALTLDPATLHLMPGETARLNAQALLDDGTPAQAGRILWKSLRPEIAAVDSAGNVSARAPGRTVVQASAGGVMATAGIEVDGAEAVLSKTRLVIPAGSFDTLQLVVPSQGNRPLASGVVWRSTDSNVVRVGSTGIVQAVAPGTAEVLATGSFPDRHATVVVHQVPSSLGLTPSAAGGPIPIPLNETRAFSVVAHAADSMPIAEIRIHWEVGDSAIAAFDPTTGTLRAKALGATSLTAKVAGLPPASWAITVVPGTLRLERSRTSLSPRERTVVGASLIDDRGRVIGPAAGLTWRSDRADVATVDAQGSIQAAGLGHTTVSATTAWGATAKLDVYVVGELLAASSRAGKLGIYQALASVPDSLIPVLVDSATNREPAFSPDRTRIAFSSNRAKLDGNYDLYVMSADGSNVQRLTTEAGTDGEPAWTPDGTRIVFTSARGGVPQIFLLPAEGGDAVPLTALPTANYSPIVAPDGHAIMFVSLRDGGPRIYRMGLDGSGQTRVTTGGQREICPRFFANGDLAYGVERSSGSREWRIVRSTPGVGAVALFQTEQPLVTFTPSRDGYRILYVTSRQMNGNQPRVEYRAFLRSLTLGAVPVPLKLHPGEQLPSVSF